MPYLAEQVQVLALTDHDTMAGVPAALETANRLGIRLIPGVEISAKVTAKYVALISLELLSH